MDQDAPEQCGAAGGQLAVRPRICRRRLCGRGADRAGRAGRDAPVRAAVVDAHLGRVEEALPAAGAGSPKPRASRTRRRQECALALGHVALSTGDAAGAERVLGALWRDSQTAGIVEPGENRYLGDLVEALVALGRMDEADQVAAKSSSAARARPTGRARGRRSLPRPGRMRAGRCG